MVKHIFKLIWNEKKANAWLFAEYILVFCILWFCTDFIYNATKAYYSDIGYDITETFQINMSDKPDSVVAEENGGEAPAFDRVELVDIFLDRVGRYPDVESVSISQAASPYSGSYNMGGWKIDSDSMNYNLNEYRVSSGFFDVFRIEAQKGRLFDWEDTGDRNSVVLVPLNDRGDFGSSLGKFGFWSRDDLPDVGYKTYYAGDIETLYNEYRGEGHNEKKVIGFTSPLRRGAYSPYWNSYFEPYNKTDISLSWTELIVRVKPGRGEGFEERFMKDMFEQLQIGPYYLASVMPMEKVRKQALKGTGKPSQMRTIYSVTFFIIINVFLGIMGTFWFRTQSRRSEVGLRMAMGSSRKKVIRLFAGETLLLLLSASVVGTIICMNINNEYINAEIFDSGFSRSRWGIGPEQDILNFAFAFLFLAVVSLFAVWYPAKQASDTQPAEVLHEE